MSTKDTAPPIRNSQPPPLHEMDWQEFQRFTTDVLGEEKDVATSSEYALPGPKTDRGADVIAHLKDSEKIDIGSCKRYQTTTATKIKKWSDEFLSHWDSHWKDRNVRRFVLATSATNLIERDIRDQIAEETNRFKTQYGIAYELWGPVDFRRKLRNHRAIASSYLGEFWADAICGRIGDASIATKSVKDVLNAGVVGQLSELQEKLSGQVAKRADTAVDALRAGNVEPARELVNELRSESEWSQLLPEAHARIIRVEGTLALLDDQLEEAKRLAAELSELPQPEERRLEAQIAFREGDASKAIEILGSPTSIAGKQLLASIYLDDGQLEQGEAVIIGLLQEETTDAETLRLRALAHLLNGNREAALTSIKEAEERSGHWTAIIIAGAIIRYAQAISPVARREWYMAPNPVDLSLVKLDAKSREALQQAIALFERWGTLDDRPLDAKHWKLAALCNLADRREEASELAAQLLEADPTDVTAIAWVVMRAIDCDVSASFEALKSEYLRGTDIFKVRALAAIIGSHPDFEGEAHVLAEGLGAQSGDVREEAELWWNRLRKDRDQDRVLGDDPELGDVINHIRSTDEWDALRPVLAQSFSGERPDSGALVLAQFAAEHKQWKLLADYTDPILEFGTAQAVRLAAFVLANNDMPDRALALIDSQADAFGENIPSDIYRLRANLELELGQLQDALQHADIIGSSANSLPDQLLGAQIKARVGDLRGAAETVAEAYRQNALSPLEALQWSQLLELHDRKLAKNLFHYGVRDGVDSQYAAAVMHQAFRLGLDHMVGQFMPQVNEQAIQGDSSVQFATVDELVEMATQNAEAQREIDELYLKGALPGHAAVRGKIANFAHMYLAGPEVDPVPLSAKLTRHGSRPRDIDYGSDWLEWRIYLDISGLLEAYNADLLDILASHPTPIMISPRLPELLQRMEHEAIHYQPARIETLASTISRIDGGEISVARTSDATERKIIFGSDDAAEEASWNSLLKHVVAKGLATESDIKGIAEDEAVEADFDLEEGSNIYANFSALEQLQRIGALEFLVTHYRVSTDLVDVDQARLEIKVAKIGDETASKLAEIREFIASGLRRGQFEALAYADLADDGQRDILMESLADILVAPKVNNGVVWIDDRMLNGYPHANEMPIVSVLDVLNAVAHSDMLTLAEKRDRIAGLRSKGAVFLPFDIEDAVPALRKAPISSDQIIESDELRSLRRHFAATCRVLPNAKIGEKDERLAGRPDETEIARTYLGAASNSLAEIWGDESADISRCYAVADWIWFNLRLGEVTHRENWDDVATAQDFFEAMEVGQCLIGAIEIGSIGASQLAENRNHYLNWLWQRAIEPKLAIDDRFLERVGDYLENFYGGLLTEYRKRFRGRDLDVLEALLGQRIGLLPGPILQVIAPRQTFARFYRTRSSVTIGKHHFDPIKFWKAARAAMRYGKARVRTDKGRIARLVRSGDGLILRKPVRAKLTDDLLVVLAARKEERPQAVDQVFEKLELPPLSAEEYRNRAIKAVEPHRLAEVLHEAANSAQARRYENTKDKLKTNKMVGLHEFAPISLPALEHYLGIPPGSETFDLSASYDVLLKRVGGSEALRRLAGVPIKIAGHVEPTIETVIELAAQSQTPIAKAQLIAIRREAGESDANDEVEALLASIDRCGACFLAILKWVWRWSFRDVEWRPLQPGKRAVLVWAHANTLTEMFAVTTSDLERVTSHFTDNQLDVQPNDLFVSNRSLPVDIASPRWMTEACLVYHALALIFGEVEVSDLLSDELLCTIQHRLTMQSGEVRSPTLELMMRFGAHTENGLNDFLTLAPRGVLPDNLDPRTTLDAVIDGALDHLETTPDSRDGWMQLVAFAPSGLTDEQWERAKPLIAKVGLWNLPFLLETMQFKVWRTLLSPALLRDWEDAAGQLTELARHCRERFGGRINPQGDETAKQGYDAIGELVEAAAVISSTADVDAFDERFELIICRIVSVWSEAAFVVRPMINELTSRTLNRRAESLNDLRNLMRRYP